MNFAFGSRLPIENLTYGLGFALFFFKALSIRIQWFIIGHFKGNLPHESPKMLAKFISL